MNVEIATGFSNPFEPFDEEFRVRWARLVSAQRARVFLDRWSPALRRESDGLEDTLRAFAERLAGAADDDELFEIAWHPFCNLAPIDEGDANSPAAALARAAQFTLRLAEFDAGVTVNVRLPAPVALGFNRYQLPVAAELRLTGRGSTRRIDLLQRDGWTIHRFEREGAEWRLRSGKALLQPVVSIAGEQILVYPLARSIERPDERVIPADAAAVGVLQSALELIERTSAAYSGWIARMLRAVVPLRPAPGRFDSETFASLYGTAYISLHPDVIRLAETLVHEVSHDYLHLLSSVDRLADGPGGEDLFSPVRQCSRPAIGVLKAQHAFVNALVFYYLLELSGVTLEGAYIRGIDKLEDWRSDMEASLEHARSVTSFGECLWRPLARRADQFRKLHSTVERQPQGAMHA